MKIVFYSSNVNNYQKDSLDLFCFPNDDEQFTEFTKKYPNDSFFCISQEPAFFMPKNHTMILDQKIDYKDFAKKIIEFKPDYAIALTYWTSSFDWLSINDSLIGEELQKNGIKTICHSLQTSLICFDKYKTHIFLEKNKFLVPRTVFVDHDLLFCASSHKDVNKNIYKDCIFSQIKKMNFPVVIKSVTGLSSYGLTVAQNYGEAICYLNSKKNNSNRIIQEYIFGEHFGLEVYGANKKYKITKPLLFSVNQYGITSPKLSSKKLLTSKKYKKYKINQLNKTILHLANKMNFSGVTQIDLIFNGKWNIVEINSRLSGMTRTYEIWLKKSIFEILFDSCIKIQTNKDFFKNTKNFLVKSSKNQLQSNEQINSIINQQNVFGVSQIINHLALQEREKGYCEIISVKKSYKK